MSNDNPEYKALSVSPNHGPFPELMSRTIKMLGEVVDGDEDVDQVMVWMTMIVPVMLLMDAGPETTPEEIEALRQQYFEYCKGVWEGLIDGHISNPKVRAEIEAQSDDSNVFELINKTINKRPI